MEVWEAGSRHHEDIREGFQCLVRSLELIPSENRGRTPVGSAKGGSVHFFHLTSLRCGSSLRVRLAPGEAAMVRWLLASLLLFPSAAWAHGGGLDANGFRHDRKTGSYHCHRASGAAPSPQAPALFSAPPVPATRGTSGGVISPAGVMPVRFERLSETHS